MTKEFKNKIDEIIRVNHAGEYGAQRIYSGQIKYCKDKKLKDEEKPKQTTPRKKGGCADDGENHGARFHIALSVCSCSPPLRAALWHFAAASTSSSSPRAYDALAEASRRRP